MKPPPARRSIAASAVDAASSFSRAGLPIIALVGLVLGVHVLVAGAQYANSLTPQAFAPPPGVHAAAPWLSPDGRTVAFTGTHAVGRFQIYRRDLTRPEIVPVEGTERHILYGYSPDSQWLLASHEGVLKKVPLEGGGGTAIVNDFGRAADWGPEDTIAQGSDDGLWLVSLPEGERTQLTTLGDGETGHWLPHFLPDGRALLFFIAAGKYASRDEALVAVYDLDSGVRRTLVTGTSPKYGHGHLVFWREGALWAVPFDPVELAVEGTPMRVADGVLADAGGFASFSIGRDGSLLMLQETADSEASTDSLQIVLAPDWLDPRRQAEHSQGRASQQQRMVDHQISGRGIEDARVIQAMRDVPRHLFVPKDVQDDAYGDGPLPIGADQTITQPYIVAHMTEALRLPPGARVLEIGTGSGYQAAVLAEIAAEVYTIEIVPELAERSASVLAQLGYDNVFTRLGDGYQGWPEAAPFDGIIVTAAPDHVPAALVDQLAPGARLVIPVGRFIQEVRVITVGADGVSTEKTIPVRFVPMTGAAQK